MLVLRSLLFIPGNNAKMLGKAPSTPADAVILDLEDAVPLADKAAARKMVSEAIAGIRQNGVSVFVRINSLPTGLTADDLKGVVPGRPDGVMLAKSETSSDILECERLINDIEREHGVEAGSVNIVPLIESAKGIVNSYEIASASRRVVAMAFGAGDYCRDLGRNVSFLSPQQTELLFARAQLINCSVAAGVQPIDTPFFGVLSDADAFTKECTMGMQLGFKGKLLIHPNQVETANATFAPTAAEIDYANRLVAAFSEAKTKGLGAISFEGKMVDEMSYQQAVALAGFGALIAEKNSKRSQAA